MPTRPPSVSTLIVGLSLSLSAGCAGNSGSSGATGGNAGNTSAGGQTSAGGATVVGSTTNCNCVRGSYVPVCGSDGKTYDASCGDVCVPVAISCRGQCPCPSGTGGSSGTGGGSNVGGNSNPGTSCVAQQGSCAQGEKCCTGLTCCAGMPVPKGSEYCGKTCPISDQNLKRGFVSVDQREVLEKLSKLPIARWSYKTEGTQVQHLGPTAQDFMATFGLGSSDTTILQVDADGVAFAAIQALNARLNELEAANLRLQHRVRELEGGAEQCATSLANRTP